MRADRGATQPAGAHEEKCRACEHGHDREAAPAERVRGRASSERRRHADERAIHRRVAGPELDRAGGAEEHEQLAADRLAQAHCARLRDVVAHRRQRLQVRRDGARVLRREVREERPRHGHRVQPPAAARDAARDRVDDIGLAPLPQARLRIGR
jgi:hypothetical protein